MLVEKRIKELAEECYAALPVRGTKDTVMNCVRDFFRTVAAESRREGIDEMRDATKRRADILNDALWIGEPELDEVAELLKEQG